MLPSVKSRKHENTKEIVLFRDFVLSWPSLDPRVSSTYSIILGYSPLGGGCGGPLTIMLNGDAFEIARPLTVAELLTLLDIDARRVAVEHNLIVLKRDAFDRAMVTEGDAVEIVNFVGGGAL